MPAAALLAGGRTWLSNFLYEKPRPPSPENLTQLSPPGPLRQLACGLAGPAASLRRPRRAPKAATQSVVDHSDSWCTCFVSALDCVLAAAIRDANITLE